MRVADQVTVQVTSTRYGRPALEALRREIAQVKSADSLAPVTVVAPHREAGIQARRFLAAGIGGYPGFAGAQFLTPSELLSQLATPLLGDREPLSSPVLTAAWRSVLSQDPGIFAPVAHHPATVEALSRAYRTLRGASDRALDQMAAADQRTGDLVRMFRAVQAAVSADFYDGHTIAVTAARALTEDPHILADLGTVVWYLPQPLSAAPLRAFTTIAARVPLRIIAGFTGVRRADQAVEHIVTQLGGSLTGDHPLPATATAVWHASDADDEVRLVVRGVMEALGHHPGHRIGVFYAANIPYARQLSEQFHDAGIAVAGPGTLTLAETAVARGFLGLLQLAGTELPRTRVFDVLHAVRVFSPLSGEAVPVVRWERISRDAGIISSTDWQVRLSHYITRQQQHLTDKTAADRDTTFLTRLIDQAQSLAHFIDRLQQDLASGQGLRRWTALAEWAETMLGYVEDPQAHIRGNVTVSPDQEREQRARDEILRLLAHAVALEAFEPHTNLSALIDMLRDGLQMRRLPADRIGTGVWVGPLTHAVGMEVDHAFIVGLAEDIYPGKLAVDALLPDEVRALAGGELPLLREELHDKQRALHTALVAAPQVSASFPRGDLRGGANRIPSQWLLGTLRELSGDKTLSATDWAEQPIAGVVGYPSHAAGLAGLVDSALPQLPATAAQWRVQAIIAGSSVDDAVLSASIVLRDARESAAFTRFDGNLSSVHGLPDFAADVIAPTTLEAYARCPHSYFMRTLLGIYPVEQPEEIVEIGALDIGNIFHEILYRLITESAADLPGYGEPWSKEHHERADKIFTTIAADTAASGLTGHLTLWERQRETLRRELHTMLEADSAWRADNDARVVASEMAFGEGRHPHVTVALPHQRQVHLRGSADKVDITRDGTLIVSDLKTGRTDQYAAITPENPTADGTKLQLPVYALAALQRYADIADHARARYWFRQTDKAPLIDLALTSALQDNYAAVLDVLTRSISSGLFPAKAPSRPDKSFVQCWYCNPDGVDNTPARQRWERKRTSAELRELLTLLEPDALDEPVTIEPTGGQHQ